MMPDGGGGERLTMHDRTSLGLGGRVLLVLLTLYALGQIVPDFYRLVHPLASFGVSADDDGRIFDVRAPFDTDEASPPGGLASGRATGWIS